VVANYLASAYVRIADFPRALAMLDRALTVQEELGNHRAVATALGNQAGLYLALGRHAECVASGRASLRLRALSGDTAPARATLQNLGGGYGKLGRHTQALYYRRLAFFAAIDAGDAVGVAIALNHIQKQRRALGRITPEMAARYLDVALRLTRRHGHRAAEAEVLDEQAILLRDLGRFTEATAAHEAAIAIMAEASDRLYVATFSYDLAVTRAMAGDQAGAQILYRRALRAARELGAMDLVDLAEAGLRRGEDQLRPPAERGTMVG
jgi:tetratricopeptide (TPR) repeat protein